MFAMTTEVFINSVVVGLLLGGVFISSIALYDIWDEKVTPWIMNRVYESSVRRLVASGHWTEEEARETVAGWMVKHRGEEWL